MAFTAAKVYVAATVAVAACAVLAQGILRLALS